MVADGSAAMNKTAYELDKSVAYATEAGFGVSQEERIVILPGNVRYRIAKSENDSNGGGWVDICTGTGSTLKCNKTCGTSGDSSCADGINDDGASTEDDIRKFVALVSSGGQATSCSCPIGYTQVVHRYTTTEQDSSGKPKDNPKWKSGDTRTFCVFTPESKS